jgi:hypothetical protein
MAIQVINDPYRSIGGGLGASLGQGLGSGLSSGLEMLAKQRLQEVSDRQKNLQQQQAAEAERKRYEQTVSKIPGMQPEIAQLLAGVSPEERKALFQNLSPLMQLFQQEQGLPQAVPQGETSIPGQQSLNQTPDLLKEAFTSPAEKRQQETLALKRTRVGRELSKDVRDFSKPYIERAEASEKNIRDYKTLIKLADKKGSEGIRSGVAHQILSKFGLEDFNQNFNTQLANKLIARLGQNIGSAFGGTARITNFLEQTFQKSLPSLWNTPEGIKAIAESNMLADEANIVKDNVRKEIIRENKGAIPYDIQDQIRDRAKPQLDTLEDQAISILNRAGKEFKVGQEISMDDLQGLGENSEAVDDATGIKYFKKKGILYKQAPGESIERIQ